MTSVVTPDKFGAEPVEERHNEPITFGRFLINPNNPYMKIWEISVNFSIFISSLMVMFLAAFESSFIRMWMLVYIAEFFQILDMIKTTCTAYTNNKGILVKERQMIVKRYLRTAFLWDLTSAFPTEILVIAFPEYSTLQVMSLLRLNRLLRLYKVYAYISKY